jgi:hypothetical protein
MADKVKVAAGVGARNLHQHVTAAGVVVQVARDIVD